MKGTPGTLQEGGASFATTHWSIVAQSALTDVPEAADALARLCEMYWPPIYSFIRRRGYAPSDAQDLTQSFFAFFLRTKAYARTDRLHGKFRSFLLASVKISSRIIGTVTERSNAAVISKSFRSISRRRKRFTTPQAQTTRVRNVCSMFGGQKPSHPVRSMLCVRSWRPKARLNFLNN